VNADDFYEEFKAALKYLDVPWGEKERVTVAVVHGDRFLMVCDGRDVSFPVGSRDNKGKAPVSES